MNPENEKKRRKNTHKVPHLLWSAAPLGLGGQRQLTAKHFPLDQLTINR